MIRLNDQAEGPGGSPGVVHMLSFDVEEYFHVEAARVDPGLWGSYATRLAPCVDEMLGLLAEHRASATFFVLGWVARRQSDLVRTIARAGHEVASHGMTHAMVHRLGPDGLRQELIDSRNVLEDLTGRPVVGFRAPTFSITRKTAWALDVLAETGYRYDSSVFPVHHDRYGVPDAPTVIHNALGPGGGAVREIPPLCMRVLGTNLPVGGGGYLRLLPVRLLGRALRAAEARRQPAMIYLHPWEFDPGQPHLPMGRLSRWRHRVNLGRTALKLRWLLERFRFCGVRDCGPVQTGGEVPVFRYG